MGFVVHAVKRRRGEVEYSDGRVIRGWDSAHSLPTIFFFLKKEAGESRSPTLVPV